MWLSESDVGPPTTESYGKTWFDLESFIRQSGHTPTTEDVEVLGPLGS
jgi:hypothetical protein